MVKSITISKKTYENMVDYYKDFSISPPQHAIFACKLANFNIIIYKSLKVVFNGDFTDEDVDMWLTDSKYYLENMIGSDEVGTGDFFGPIVVASVHVSEKDISKLKDLNVADSKSFKDDRIMLIAEELTKFLNFKVVSCSNKRYNELYSKGYNIKQILAIMHDKAITSLDIKCKTVIDQFVSKNVFEKYLNKQVDYEFVTKGETHYVAIAAASIIARAYFITKMSEMENEINELTKHRYKLKYGASSECDNIASQIASEIGKSTLKNYVKANFKNFERV